MLAKKDLYKKINWICNKYDDIYDLIMFVLDTRNRKKTHKCGGRTIKNITSLMIMVVSSKNNPKLLEVIEKYLQENDDKINKISSGYTALTLAIIKECNLEIIKLLLKFGADINKTKKKNILFLARKNTELMQLLISHGAKIDGVLHYFTKSVSIEAVKLLVQHGADINGFDEDNNTYLMQTLENNNIIMARLLISLGCEDDRYNMDKNNALMIYLESNEAIVDVINLLLDNGSEINHEDWNGKTPFMIACHNNKIGPNVIEFLIKKGAVINQCDHGGDNALFYASSKARTDKVELLLKHGADNLGNALISACSIGHIETAQILLDKGADINHINHGSVLMASYKNPDIINLLIDREVNLLSCDHVGNNILMKMLFMDLDVNQNLVKKLLDHGLDINTQNIIGETILMMMMSCEYNGEILKFLLEHKPNINLRNNHGETALFYAINTNDYFSGLDDIVLLLLQHEADPNIMDNNNKTALMLEIEKKENMCTDTILELLKHGTKITPAYNKYFIKLCKNRDYDGSPLEQINEILLTFLDGDIDVNIKDKNGDCALAYYIMYMPRLEILKKFLEKGQNVNIRNQKNETLLMMAIDSTNNYDIIECLLKNGADPYVINKEGKTIANMLDELVLVKTINYINDQYYLELRNKLDFYEQTLDLHPDGLSIKELSKEFEEKCKRQNKN